MAGRLIARDNNPGVRPIAFDEVMRRLIASCVLSVAKREAQEACRIDQLCGGLQSGMEGGILLLFIDARNAFNEINRTVMLWVIRHEWPSGARDITSGYKPLTARNGSWKCSDAWLILKQWINGFRFIIVSVVFFLLS